jgi:NitT/TauT family transport system ATP-binding protein
MSVPDGAFAALIGPSGCGKSTALRMIAGLDLPTTGTVQTGGLPPAEAVRSHQVGVAFQDPGLLPWRSVRRNVLLALEVVGRRDSEARVDELIEMVGLAEFKKARPAELSGGMRQRVALARTLVTSPKVLLLDEPFGALDEFTRERLNRELQDLWLGLRPTTLLVTHSILEAVYLSDFVVVMSERPGRVIGRFTVPFARPRPYDIVETSDFLALSREIGHCLRSSMPAET